MALDCYCDYDAPQVYSSKVVRARKLYSCDECGKKIRPGEQYEYAFGVIDGYTYQPHTCMSCKRIRDFVSMNIPCWCWAHGNVLSDAREIVEAAYREAPDEVRGLAFGLGRLMVAARRERKLSRTDAENAAGMVS